MSACQFSNLLKSLTHERHNVAFIMNVYNFQKSPASFASLPNVTIDNKVIFHYENLTVRLYIEMRTENTQREIPLGDLYLNWICLLKCLFLLTIVFFLLDANTFTECSTSPATLPFMISLLVCAVTLECLNILRDHIIWYFSLVSLMMILSYSISIND